MSSSTTSSVTCERFEENLSDYLEGALGKGDSVLFGEHAMQCRGCRSLLDEVRAAVSDCHREGPGSLPELPTLLEESLLAIAAGHRAVDCHIFEELITEVLDGFVPAPVYHRFEEHAALCQLCSSLLTDVVYAVAACHSVHTYEEVEHSEAFYLRLVGVGRQGAVHSLTVRSIRRLGAGITWLVASVLPRPSSARRWSVATAASLVAAMFTLLLYGFSDDHSVTGIYRQAQYEVARLYSRGANIYAQKDVLAARIEKVGLGLDEIWDGLGGDKTSSDAAKTEKKPDANERKPDASDTEKSRPPQLD